MESLSRDPASKKPKEKKTKTLRQHLKLSEFRLQWSMFAVLAIMLIVFMIGNPRVFLSFRIYYSVAIDIAWVIKYVVYPY